MKQQIHQSIKSRIVGCGYVWEFFPYRNDIGLK
ncbi:hypothetical protein EMST110833_03560 [Empedobacter stercoris]